MVDPVSEIDGFESLSAEQKDLLKKQGERVKRQLCGPPEEMQEKYIRNKVAYDTPSIVEVASLFTEQIIDGDVQDLNQLISSITTLCLYKLGYGDLETPRDQALMRGMVKEKLSNFFCKVKNICKQR